MLITIAYLNLCLVIVFPFFIFFKQFCDKNAIIKKKVDTKCPLKRGDVCLTHNKKWTFSDKKYTRKCDWCNNKLGFIHCRICSKLFCVLCSDISRGIICYRKDHKILRKIPLCIECSLKTTGNKEYGTKNITNLPIC